MGILETRVRQYNSEKIIPKLGNGWSWIGFNPNSVNLDVLEFRISWFMFSSLIKL
jgi:hypothetical protein